MMIFRKYFLNLKARYFSNKIVNNNVKIGISFKEGIDLDKRTDLFWYDEKNLILRIFLSILREILINTDLKEKRNYTKNLNI